MIVNQSLTDLIPDGYLEMVSDAVSKQALSAIAAQARDYWIQLAQEQLQSTQLDYIKGIQAVAEVPGQPNKLEIALVGAVPASIENDTPAYDMRNTLLGPNVPVVPARSGQKGKHQSKRGGFYRTIPFSHQGPGGQGVTGTPIGRPYEGHANVPNVQEMAAAIFKAAKKLAPTKGMPGQKITYGGRLPAGMAPLLQPHHKTDIYAGMLKQTKTYKKATQSTYTTFRTISTNGTGWMRKATTGKHFCEQVAAEVKRRIGPETFAALLKGTL